MGPKLVIAPNDVTVTSGQTATLYCEAEGVPKPVLSWKRGRIDITQTSRVHVLKYVLDRKKHLSCNFSHTTVKN